MYLDKKVVANICLCHEQNEKKRCPLCGSLETKKKGFYRATQRTRRGSVERRCQRFYCLTCHHSFNDSGYQTRKCISEDLKQHAVNDYTLTKNSLSEVAQRYKVAKTSIINWMQQEVQFIPDENILPPLQNPSGIIMLDGKEIKVNKKHYTLLVAIDAVSHLPIHYALYEKECSESSVIFLTAVKEKYPITIKGVISDFGKGKCFIQVVEKLFPGVPHQICLVHFWRYVNTFVPRTKRSEFYHKNVLFKQWLKNTIYAPNREESLFWLKRINNYAKNFPARYHKRLIRSINVNYDYLTRYLDYNFLNTNNNPLENLNKQLNRKLKNLDNFKSLDSLTAFVKLWFSDYFIRKQTQ